MLLDGKIKRVALLAAVDICLRRGKSSPKRCARNLIELGVLAYPDKLSSKEQNDLYDHLIEAIIKVDITAIHSLFSESFFYHSLS